MPGWAFSGSATALAATTHVAASVAKHVRAEVWRSAEGRRPTRTPDFSTAARDMGNVTDENVKDAMASKVRRGRCGDRVWGTRLRSMTSFLLQGTGLRSRTESAIRPVRRALWPMVLGALMLSACRDDKGVAPIVEPSHARIASLIVSPASVNLQAGQERTLTVEARDSVGQLIANPVVSWRTDAPTVATVDARGTVRGVSPGNAQLTAAATTGSVAASVPVTISAATPGLAQWRAARPGLTDVTFLGIWDDGAGSTYAVGQNGGLLRSRNDGPWEYVSLGHNETVVGVWGAAPTDIWLVGSGGLIMRGDGNTFRRITSNVTGTLLEVWGLSSNEVYITGDRGTILRWNGATLEPMVSGVGDELWGIWGASTNALYAVGNNGTLLRYDGFAWRRMASPDGMPYFDVWGTSENNVFAVGVGGSIVRYDGSG